MHTWQHDPSLAVPVTHFDAAGGALPFDMAPLRRPAVAAAPTNIGGRFAEAVMSDDGVQSIVVDGIETMRCFHVIDARSVDDVMTSIGLQRALVSNRADVTLRFMVLPDVPAFLAEISSAATHAVTLEWLHYASTDMRWNSDRTAIVLAGAAGHICVAFANSRVEWVVEEISSAGACVLRVRAIIPATPTGVLMYATSSRLPATIAATLRALSSPAGSARAFIGAQRRRIAQSIALDSPDAGLDTALAWAVQSIAVPRPYADDRVAGSHPAIHALAACAAGNPGIARAVIASLHEHDPFLPLLIARYHAWTADSAFVVTQWHRAQAAVARMVDASARPDPDARVDSHASIALTLAALTEIVATAGDIGRAVMSADMQARVSAFRNEHAPALLTAHWIDSVQDAEADALRTGRFDFSGYAIRSPAAMIADVAYGMFGIEPEAARNRVRFRTHLPADWSAASVRGIQIGDAMVSLRYARTLDATTRRVIHSFDAVQDRGPVPIRLILEPMIDATCFYSATVDGVSAQLDVRARGRLIIPVQVVLDDARVIEIVTDQAAAGR